MRAVADHVLSANPSEGEVFRHRMAMTELYSCVHRDQAIELWHVAANSDERSVATQAWLNSGFIQ